VLRNVAQGYGLSTDFFFSGYGRVAGSCEHGNEPSSAMIGGEFLVKLDDYQLLLRKINYDETYTN
jgi:hypothetical protein